MISVLYCGGEGRAGEAMKKFISIAVLLLALVGTVLADANGTTSENVDTWRNYRTEKAIDGTVSVSQNCAHECEQ